MERTFHAREWPHTLSLAFLLTLMLATKTVAEAPNILFILGDDVGWNDVSWNNPDVITPNLNRMVQNGVILNQAYSQSTCTPSRAAYLTGYYPYKIGVQNTVVRDGSEDYVPLKFTFLPEKLQEAGYSTHLVGKWHVGHCRRDVTPTNRGFDSFLGLYNAYNDFYTKKNLVIPRIEDFDPTLPGKIYDFFLGTDVLPSPEDEYTTDIFTNRTIDLIKDRNRGTPFFIALHYTAAHWPLQVHSQYRDLYPNEENPDRQTYLGMVTKMDEGIGQVLDTLENEDILDNTIVIFHSDNGGDTYFGASNLPLRGRKDTLYEGGARVPSLVYSPNLISNTPRVNDELSLRTNNIISPDEDRTAMLKACGDKQIVDSADVDGKDQWDMIQSGAEGPRNIFIYNINGNRAAIRVGGYKLMVNWDPLFVPGNGTDLSKEGNDAQMESDEDKMMEAFNNLTSCLALDGDERQRGGWTLNEILDLLESEESGCIPELTDCHCELELYDLEEDPSESQNVAQDLPAVVQYIYKLLLLYKKDEVTPVLKVPYVLDPRFLPYFSNNITSNTWCEN